MKISCDKEKLTFALGSLSHIIPTRTTLPILNGVLIFTKDDQLILQSTDLELSLTIKIPVKIEEEGCTVVLGRYLTELIKRLPDVDLTLNWTEDTGMLDILYNRAAVQMNTMPAAEYPDIHTKPTENTLSFSGAKWKNMIKKVIFAAAPQDIRPNYAGVYFQLDKNQISLVATDTYRLALLTMPNKSKIAENTNLFIPSRALGEVNRLLSDDDSLEIFWDQKLISFETKKFILTTRLIDSRFPSYEKVIPRDVELTVKIDKLELLSSLERASLFVAPPDHFAIVDLNVADQMMNISAHAAQVGSLKEDLIINASTTGSCQVSFNTRFFMEPLRVIDHSEVTICLNGANGPAFYREEGEETYVHLVLPVCRVAEPE